MTFVVVMYAHGKHLYLAVWKRRTSPTKAGGIQPAMRGECNRDSQIDLDTQSWSIFSLPEEVLARYLGGKEVAADLLACHQHPQAVVEYPRDA